MADTTISKNLTIPEAAAAAPPRPPDISTNTPIDLEQPILSLSRNIKVRMMRHSDAAGIAKYCNNKKIAQNMRAAWPEPYTVDSAHDFIARTRKQDDWTCTNIGYSRTTDDNDTTKPHQTQHEQPKGIKLPHAWTITIDDEPIGVMGCEFHSDTQVRSVSIGYGIREDYWGKGMTTELVGGITTWIWNTYPYIVRQEAMVYAWNPASARVLEKVGFKHEGTLRASVWRYGRLTDLFVFGLVRDGTDVTLEQPTSGPGSSPSS